MDTEPPARAADPTAGDAPQPTTPPPAAEPADSTGTREPLAREIPRTRISATFVSLLAGLGLLALLLVFILENTSRISISYFGASTHLPAGVALLLAAVAGALIVGVVAIARIVQLRRRFRHR